MQYLIEMLSKLSYFQIGELITAVMLGIPLTSLAFYNEIQGLKDYDRFTIINTLMKLAKLK